MESLLCNEVWLMSPNGALNVHEKDGSTAKDYVVCSFYSNEEDCEEAFGIFVDKEARYMPEPGYLKLVESNNLIQSARHIAVNWIIKSQKRMSLSSATVFCAVNYLDRFISLTRECQMWKHRTFELLSIACLSVASKFNETTTIPLHEYQVEGSDLSFSSRLIQNMELTVLKALGWRMDCTTAFTYIDLLIQSIDFNEKTTLIVNEMTLRLTEFLLNTVLDPKFLKFRPCVIAISAVRCMYEELSPSTNNACVANFDLIIPQEQKEELIKCQKMVEKLLAQDRLYSLLTCGNFWDGSTSPVTVLKLDWYDFYDCHPDLSVLKMINMDVRTSLKRKREELE